jgi:predicted nucleotidyltransferase
MVDTGLEANPDPRSGYQTPLSYDSSLSSDIGLSPLESAIVKTVAYVDIYDYPLTGAEVHRYLIGLKLDADKLNQALNQSSLIGRHLNRIDGFYTLPGRADIVAKRRQREKIAEVMWPKALQFGRIIARLPFVSMVTVTGSLAVNNADLDSDIDYLIVTENDHLWTARALVVLVVKLAARRGVALCPNYLVSKRALVFKERNLYTAREVAQMVPIAGLDIYHRMREVNDWVEEFLPNAKGVPPSQEERWRQGSKGYPLLSKSAEALLRTPPGNWIERWEMDRKERKFARLQMGDESAFSPDWCKGHFENHGRSALERFDANWRRIADRGADD